MRLVVGLAIGVALASAVRGYWSPCGLSMLSTITPLAEAGRGYRFRTTAAWFMVGAVCGGTATGLVAALLAVLVGGAGPSTSAVLGFGALAALAAAAVDAEVFGRLIPIHKRQVNQSWLSQYRSWVYGGGFGFQIGTGVATYIMTAGVFLTITLAALTGSPTTALGICVAFGTVRGLGILMGARITSPQSLASFHRSLDSWREPVRFTTLGVQLVVALAAAVGAWGLGAGAGLVALASLATVAVAASPRQRDRSGTVDVAHPVSSPA